MRLAPAYWQSTNGRHCIVGYIVPEIYLSSYQQYARSCVGLLDL